MLNFLPPIPCITGPCPFFLAFLPQWGISGKSWWDVPPGSQTPDLISDKNFHYPHLFSALKLLHLFKILSNSHIILLSCSFGIKMTNTFIHSRSSLANHSWFQTKMCKVYTLFQTETAQKPSPLRQYIPIWLLKGSTIPGFPPFRLFSITKYTRKL